MGPETLGKHAALEGLELRDCKALIALPESLGQLAALERLGVYGCNTLTALLQSLGQSAALKKQLVAVKKLKLLLRRLRQDFSFRGRQARRVLFILAQCSA